MNLLNEYVKFLRGFIEVEGEIKVVIDCSNGATGPVIEELFRGNSKIKTVLYNTSPNGEFPAHGPNPLLPEAVADIRKEVQENSADLGVIFDGDGDRVSFADEKGEMVDPYSALACMMDRFAPPYVVDVRALAEFTMPGMDVIEEKVGRYFIIKTMREHKAELGGEYTGHYYFKDFFYADSGILAAILMINHTSSLVAKGQALSSVGGHQNYVRMPEFNFHVEDQEREIKLVKEYFKNKGDKIIQLDGVTIMGKEFAFNLRASFTEPTLRLNLVARKKEILDQKLAEIKEVLGLK